MKYYAGADWLQSNLDILHKINPKKNPETKLSPLGVKVADFLGQWKFGIYHLDQKELFRADWTNNHHIEISIWCNSMSTYDFDDLTRLVFLAHQMALRVQIEPSTHHYMRIMFHGRTHGERTEVEMHHPTLDEAVESFKKSIEETMKIS